MIEVRGFTGKLNLDDNPYRLPSGDYNDALNITRDAQGTGQDEVISNILGNTIVTDTLPAGTNKVIGNYADRVRNRQYFFTWNSNGNNRISYYDGNTGAITVLVEDLTDTNNISVLNFDPSFRINHIDILYRDVEGDLLFWTDGLNPPSKINIQKAETGAYGTIQRSFLDVAKEPPAAPPYCVYEDDITVTVNNLQNKLFKFKYRFVYDDLEKSVTSAQSAVALPLRYSEQETITDPTKNADIFIVLQSGADNVTKIELLGAESLGDSWSDFFLIKVFDKADLSISSNDVFYYRFYNDETYNPISLTESVQPFDLVPQKAYAQTLPNGNVLNYGAITEGYNTIIPDFFYTNNLTPVPAVEYKDGLLVVAYQSGQPAFGSGDIKIIVAGVIDSVTVSTGITINTLTGTFPAQTLVPVTTSAISGVDTINDVLVKLLASAGLGGYTTGSISGNELTIGGLPTATIDTVIVGPTEYDLPSKNSKFAYDWASKYAYGVVYFDEKGRTNGVITSPESVFTTSFYNEQLVNVAIGVDVLSPKLSKTSYTISSRPPLWARYFEIVRTRNLTKSNFLYWISAGTYKDQSPNDSGYKYAYISISNLTDFILNNPDIKALGYEFTPGDRIRFVKLYTSSGGTNVLYDESDPKDFEIIDSLTNPTINGEIVTGQTLKIYLPDTSSTFDFGDPLYSNYLIEIYTPQKSFNEQSSIYYEFGQRYIIGEAGTANAYHQGMTQNQTPDLSNFAVFQFIEGDSYFRYRSIPTGGTMKWSHAPVVNITTNAQNFHLLASLTTDTSNNPDYTPQDVTTTTPASNTSYPLIINNLVTPPSFRIKGVLKVKSSVNVSNINLVSYERQGASILIGTQVFCNTLTLVANQEKTIQIDVTYTPTAGYSQVGWGLGNFRGDLVSLELTITDAKIIEQGIIDPNFSDNYVSTSAPNGRPWRYDPNARQEFNPTLIRFGGEYQPGTAINEINRFYEQNFDIYDRSRGAIKKMFIEGRNEYVFQEFDVGVVTILTQIVRDTAQNPLSAESDRLLNKIVYPYIGQFGIGDVPESFAYGKSAKFFVDNNKGVVCRLSADGIKPISIIYKTNAFFVSKLKDLKVALSETPPATGTPTVYGAYDAYTNKYIIKLDALIINSIQVQPEYAISYLDSRDTKDGFESFLSFLPENMGALNNDFITFKNGRLYIHNNTTYCNFYSVQYNCHVQIVFNDQALVKKTYLAITETANTAWSCPTIQSQLNTYGNVPQQSSLNEARFTLLEGQYSSAILRDANSPGGIINGDAMKGNYLIVKFQKNSASSFFFLSAVSVKFIESPLNPR